MTDPVLESGSAAVSAAVASASSSPPTDHGSPFADPRIAEITRRVDSGAYSVLSLDVFDTLVFRRVARPSDAFFLLADALGERGAMWSSSSRESFVSARIQAENRARQVARSPEITLEQIWRQFPAGYLRDIGPAEGAALEFEVERGLVAPHADVVALAEHARSRGLRIALVSDTYFTAPQLRELTGFAADYVVASCEHGVSKYQGLHRVLLGQCQAAPERVLHVGDSFSADVEGPKAFRIATFHLAKFPAEYDGLADREWPASLSRREEFVRNDDGGITALRGRALCQDTSPYARWGAGVLGPAIAGFCGWVAERCSDLEIDQALCLMREGRVLKQVLDTRADGPAAHECVVSRYVALKAAIFEASEAELGAFVFRPSPQRRGRILEQLGLTSSDVPGDADDRLPPSECMALVRRIAVDAKLRRKVVDASGAVRRRLLAHIDSLVGPGASGTLAIVDLGYRGTIQGCLHRIFARERKELRLHGLYLVTGAEASETESMGATLEGWLAENGQPVGMAHTFVRSPEIAEQSLMADCGTTLGHADDGTPILDTPRVADAQRQAIAEVQRGLLAWARAWAAHCATCGVADTWGLHTQYRAIMMNAVARPLPVELELFGSWGHDENFGSDDVRTLVTPVDMHEWELEHLSAHQLASLPHTRLYWPFGLATSISPALGEAVAQIYTRTVTPEVFDAPDARREITLWWDTGTGLSRRQSRTEAYALNSRGRRWQRFSMTLEGGPLLSFAIELGQVGEAIRLCGVRLHRRPEAGESAVDTFESANLELQGFRHLHGSLWLVEAEPRMIVVPARHLSGFRGTVDLDVFFGLLAGV